MATEPRRRQHGIGRRLMEELERRMRRLGVAKVNLQVGADNAGVAAFYERLGYTDEHLTSFSTWLGTREPTENERETG